MLNFLKRNKKDSDNQHKPSNDSTVDAEDLIEGVESDSSSEEVETELSINPDWKLAEEDVYVYRFMNNEHPPLKPNQLSLGAFELTKMDDEIAAGAFVRNSLNKKITFNETTILLMKTDGTKLGRKEFDLSKVGELPARSSRPHLFIFDKKELFVPIEEVPTEDWKLAFELKKSSQKHTLELEESWQKSMASEDFEKLKDYTESLKPPKPGEVNFMGLKAHQTDSGDLHVTMLIRNGSKKGIHLQQLPLQFEDASGEVVAKGGFKLENFEVSANTSKPWTFIFPKTMIQTSELDLSKWKAYPVQ
ncbi:MULTISPECIES: accessory Sec system S-layer assembly protein [Pontibacillus]|uniref:Accessory Sec system S-layer assembly protein n=1 Tax=Pontibacillus chungwhensis TaxID=265426 RepID=A0ABY8UW41_9BACI|nr:MULTISPECIES: accessory Sec system S-layer assembly protein [Pontibacillus]MCD5325928.1 accessory Sec system S-layer assembly protein [Pontibacillus sp. HN14]WIF97638.1 accessory Sec system S-layer assembly protein [Pontibacillus chungwhensis]